MSMPVYNPSQWNPGLSGYYDINIGTTPFAFEGAYKSYALTSSDNNSIRFELHPGDYNWWDAGHGVERDELASRNDVASVGQALEVSYNFTLEPGAVNTAAWVVLGQIHQDLADTKATGGPVYSLQLDGDEHMQVIARYTAPNGALSNMVLWTDPNAIVRGHNYSFDIKMIADPTGDTGRLVVTIDGVQVANYSGKLGDSNMQGVYWAEGIYRDAGTTTTIAADYSNLKITTGSAVNIPSASTFIAAPVLAVKSVTNDASATGESVTLSGTAALGATVTVFESGKAVGQGTVDATGHVAVNVVASGAGIHSYEAIATSAAGQAGVTMSPIDVVVGTSASVAGQIATLAQDAALGSIVLTDTRVLNVGTTTAYSAVMHDASVLAALGANVLLQTTDKITGKNYDTQQSTYTTSGVLLESQRFSAGKIVFDSMVAGSTTTTATWNSDGSEAVLTTVNGKTQSLYNFDATGRETSLQSYGLDGSSEVDYYAQNGALTRTVSTSSSGTKYDVSYGLTGRAYVTQEIVTSSTSNLIIRLDQSNRLVQAVDSIHGTTTTFSYDASGTMTGYRVNASDSSYSLTTYTAGTQSVAKTDYYTAKGVLISEDRSDPEAGLQAIAAAGLGNAHPGAYVQASAVIPAALSTKPLLSASSTVSSATSVASSSGSTPPQLPAAPAAPLIVSETAKASDGSITVAIKAASGTTVNLLEGTTIVGTATADISGAASITIQSVSLGSHSYTAIATDSYGQPSSLSAAASVVMLPTAPSTPTIAGESSNSSTGSVVVVVDAAAGTTVTLFEGASVVGSAVANVSGVATIAAQSISAGSHSYTATATDQYAQTSAFSAAKQIVMPSAPLGAPTIEARTISSTGSAVTVNIDTAAGAAVSLLDGQTVVGTAVANASGVATITGQSMSTGLHNLSAVATDVYGQVSATSTSVEIAVGSPVAILNTIPTLGADKSLAAVAMGGSQIIDVTAAEANLASHYSSVFAQSQDTILLRVTDIVSGLGYDKQVRLFDTSGSLLNLERSMGGRLLLDSTNLGKSSVTSTWNVDGSHQTTVTNSGQMLEYSLFNAAGTETTRQVNFADGAREIYNYDTTGTTVIKTSVVSVDGSHIDTSYGATGELVRIISATGALTYARVIDASGHTISDTNYANGTVMTYQYDSRGAEIGYKYGKADGSYSVTTLAPDGSSVAKTDFYSAKGALLSEDQSNPGAAVGSTITSLIASEAAHQTVASLLVGVTQQSILTAGNSDTILVGGSGNQTLSGGSGNDIFIAGSGHDVLTGGGGADLFSFSQGHVGTATISGADEIADFTQGDRIDLSALSSLISSHAGFSYIGTSSFDGKAGEIHTFDQGGSTYLAGDLNGDKVADFMIKLDGHHVVAVTDMILG